MKTSTVWRGLAALFALCTGACTAAPTGAPERTAPVADQPTGTAATAIAATGAVSTTTVARLEAAPGDVVVIDDALRPIGSFVPAPGTGVTLGLWLVLEAAPSSTPVAAAVDATASTVDGRVRVTFTVPEAMAERPFKFAEATPLPLRAGEYRVEGIVREVTLRVTRAGKLPILDSVPIEPIGSDRRILGGDALDDIAFGTDADAAEARLVAAIGAPADRSGWSGACTGEHRYLRWGSLVVEMRRDDPSSPGWLASYTYTAQDLTSAAAPLGTAESVVPGTGIAALRSVVGSSGFHTGYGSYEANAVVLPGGAVAFLDRDFLSARAIVSAIVAPRSFALSVC